MWEENNMSFFRWADSDEPRALLAGITYNGDGEVLYPGMWQLHIYLDDSSLIFLAHIHNDVFTPEIGQQMADAALELRQTYEWWVENGYEWAQHWWEANVRQAISQ